MKRKQAADDHCAHVDTWLRTIVLHRIMGLAKADADGCWIWFGSKNGKVDSGGRKSNGAIPVMALPNRGKQGVSTRRIAARIAGIRLTTDLVVYPVCGKRMCVRPECQRAATRAQITRMAVESGAIETGPRRSARAISAARENPHVVLNMQKAREMRAMHAEGFNCLQVAKHFGVNHQHAWSVIRGRLWREPSPFSV